MFPMLIELNELLAMLVVSIFWLTFPIVGIVSAVQLLRKDS